MCLEVVRKCVRSGCAPLLASSPCRSITTDKHTIYEVICGQSLAIYLIDGCTDRTFDYGRRA
jgi:hypothetical protein